MFKSLCLAFSAVAGAVDTESSSCNDYCHDKHGPQSSGYVMGTAPFCSGDCHDCTGGDYCGPLSDDFSDGGHSCITGSKQCCCSKPSEAEAPLEASSETESMSCDAYCTGQFGSQSIGYVMGTAPFCDGSCDDCAAGSKCGPHSTEFSDGGHTCATGSKQCCCSRTSKVEVQLESSSPSCDEFCTRHGIKYGYVRGTAPFCGAGPGDCCDHDYPGMQASSFSDGGDTCLTGSKQCCCGTPAGQSGCPKPGPGDLSCMVINAVCDKIASLKITTKYGCTELAAEAFGICEFVGLGPEDPWSEVCGVVVGGAIKIGCDSAVSHLRSFGAKECKRAAGCDTDTSVMLPTNKTSALVV